MSDRAKEPFAEAPCYVPAVQDTLRLESEDGAGSGAGGVLPPVLDACCGARMFWFDKADARAVFVDRRRETFVQVRKDCGNKIKTVDPDILCDFVNLPFADNTFAQVVFDPPHVIRNEALGNITKLYGCLNGDWKEMLRLGFAECFRVLRHEGTLIFKWTETQIPIQTILALTPEKPLFGHRVGARARTHWVSFLKCSRTLTN